MAAEPTAPEQTEDEQKQVPVTVTIKDAGPARKLLSIEIPEQRIQDKVESSYDKLQNDAALPGFRRGRAPRRLIEKRFGSDLKEDIRTQLLSEAYTEVVEEQSLEIIGEPDIKDMDDITVPDSGPMTFEVEVEVAPEVTLPALDGIAVKKPTLPVTDADIDKEIDRFRERYGSMADFDDTTIMEKDFLLADVHIYAGKDAGEGAEEIAHHPTAYILVNGEEMDYKGHVAGIVIDDLGKQLAGRKTGETLTISMTGPASHEDERIKNQDITLVIRIDKVQRLEPAPIEDAVRAAGVADEAELRERVKEMLASRNEREQATAMHKQIIDHLRDSVELDLPEGVTGRQTARMLRREAMELSYRGVPQQEIEQRIAEMREESEEDARRQLKEFFILDRASKQLEIEVSEQEINGRIHMLAAQQGRRPEKVRQEMIRSGEMENIYLQLREQKTLDAILAKAAVTEVDELPADESAQAKPKKNKSSKKSEKTEE